MCCARHSQHMSIIWVNPLHSSNSIFFSFCLLLSFSARAISVLYMQDNFLKQSWPGHRVYMRNFCPVFGGITISHPILDPAFGLSGRTLGTHMFTGSQNFSVSSFLSYLLSILWFWLPVSVSSCYCPFIFCIDHSNKLMSHLPEPTLTLVRSILYMAKLSSLISCHYPFHIFS